MTDTSLIARELQNIFRTQLRNPTAELLPDMETGAIEGWDSFANVEILLACEERWGFQFTAAEIDRIRTFGDLVNAINAKLA